MRKRICLILFCALLLQLCACGAPAGQESAAVTAAPETEPLNADSAPEEAPELEWVLRSEELCPFGYEQPVTAMAALGSTLLLSGTDKEGKAELGLADYALNDDGSVSLSPLRPLALSDPEAADQAMIYELAADADSFYILCGEPPRSYYNGHEMLENSDYAADLTVALAYNKCLDDWHDDASPLALAETAALRRSYRKVQALWPRQCEAIEQGLRALGELEKNGEADPDAAAACFGALMAELFVRREDRWAPQLRSLGGALGRFIYILDACMDLDKDALLGRYNPLRRRYGMKNAAAFRDILKMLLGDAVRAFDALPLVQDAGLMQNILCAGLWAAFDKKFGSEEGTAHGSGSL